MPGNFYNLTIVDIEHWPPVNYEDPEERTWLAPFAIVWLILSSLFLGGRILSRYITRSSAFGLDDFCIIIGWIWAVVFTCTACIAVWRDQIGRHVWDVEPVHYSGALYMGWLAQVMFVLSTGFTKTSVLLFIRRMASGYSRGWVYAIWILLIIGVIAALSIFAAYMKICTPLDAYWNFLVFETSTPIRTYTCLDGDAMTIASSVLTIAADFWTAGLPCIMFQVHDLGITRKQKYAMNIIFCLGFLVTGVGVARTYYLWRIGHNGDLSWVGYDLYVASTIELNLAIICTCAPFLRAFFRRFLPDATRSRVTNDIMQRSRNTVDDILDTPSSPGGDSTFMPLKPFDAPSLADRKTGIMVREPETGMLKPVWSGRRISIRETLKQSPYEYT